MKSTREYYDVTLSELQEFLGLEFSMEIGSFYVIQYSGQHASTDDLQQKRKSFSNMTGFWSESKEGLFKVLKLIEYKKGIMNFEDKDGFTVYVHCENRDALVSKKTYIEYLVQLELNI